jgi:tetratricopeptide (TPR) repeat protein
MAIPFLWPLREGVLRGAGRAALLLFLLAAGPAARALDDDPPAGPPPAASTERDRERAKTELERAILALDSGHTTLTNYLWVARTAYDWAEFAATKAVRAAIANRGIQACRDVIRQDPRVADAYYYLAMNQGQLARTKTLGALHLVEEIEANFKKALELDPRLDYAGPDRSLGLLYHNAPGWPMSVGSKSKARLHLRAAAALCPEYPGNHLDLLEACLSWRDAQGAEEQVAALEKILPPAPDQFKGDAWMASWDDWNARWAKLKPAAATLIDSRRREQP